MENTRQKPKKSFVERTVGSLAEALDHATFAESSNEKNGLLQSLDPRVKTPGLLALILAAVSVRDVFVTLSILVVSMLLAIFSWIPLSVLASRVWLGVLAFTGVIALPSVFITPGDVLFRIPLLHWPVVLQGAHAAIRLVARAETAATLALLLVLCTPWTHVLKALRVFRVPVVFVVILGMTHRYIFLLLNTARDFFEARRCRIVGQINGAGHRSLAAASAGVLLGKSLLLSEEVYLAMQARGFRGEVHTMDDFQMKRRDWWALAVFAGLAGTAFWIGGK